MKISASRTRNRASGRSRDGERTASSSNSEPRTSICSTTSSQSPPCQEARRRGVTYPVANARELKSHLKRVNLVFGNHRIDSEAVARTMPDAWFPIAHEGELLSRVHLALIRCEAEAAQLAPRPVFLPG